MIKLKITDWEAKEKLNQLTEWAKAGLSEEQLASNMKISVSTLIRWKNKSKKILDAIIAGQDYANVQVENALFRKATGYTTVETTVEKSNSGEKVITRTKEMCPDVTAQIFWLKNKKPEVWRDVRENRVSMDEAGINITIDGDSEK